MLLFQFSRHTAQLRIQKLLPKAIQLAPQSQELRSVQPRSRRDQVDGALYALAGDKAPPAVPGDDEEDRRQRRAGWEEWWRANGAEVRLPIRARRRMDFVVTRISLLGYSPVRPSAGGGVSFRNQRFSISLVAQPYHIMHCCRAGCGTKYSFHFQ